MTSSIFKSQVVEMSELNNLFIEMTSKSCNQRCKNCYIDFPMYKKPEDFIDIETVSQALNDTSRDNLKCIYLTGAEPMTHPDFNSILRLCAGRCDVCICTNGSFINEKKARFLKKVEGEASNRILFKISLDHYDEIKNDDVRYRGAFRHAVFAIQHLLKYDFNVIVSLTDYYNLSSAEISEGFEFSLKRYGINAQELSFQVIPFFDKNNRVIDEADIAPQRYFDCVSGRILSATGVYSCPFLSNDFRGRSGSSFLDYNKKSSLETEFCATCAKSDKPMFSADFSYLGY